MVYYFTRIVYIYEQLFKTSHMQDTISTLNFTEIEEFPMTHKVGTAFFTIN